MKIKKICIDEDTGARMYSRTEVAEAAGVSTQTIRIWEDAEVIPKAVRVGDKRYWDESGLRAITTYANLPRKERYGDAKK